MKSYIVDTNVLISFVTDRNLLQQEKAAPLFENASRGSCRLLFHQQVLTEFVYVLDRVYGVKLGTIKSMLGALLNFPGASLINEADFIQVMSVWPEKVGDLTDAILLCNVKVLKKPILATFDTRLAKEAKKLGANIYGF